MENTQALKIRAFRRWKTMSPKCRGKRVSLENQSLQDMGNYVSKASWKTCRP